LNLSSEKLVSKFAFEMQLARLRGGARVPWRRAADAGGNVNGGTVGAAAAVAAASEEEEEEDVVPLGRLAFVDLAGSERNYETLRMSAAQQSVEINTSLMVGLVVFAVVTRSNRRVSYLP
jgi:hypothetical protein